MPVEGRTVDTDGESLLIKLSSPYTSLLKINGYDDETEGENTVNYFIKEYRWSTDNKSFSDWEFLTDENLQNIEIDSDLDFWIEYRYTAEINQSGGILEFISIGLETITKEGTVLNIPYIDSFNTDDCENYCNALIISEDCGDSETFNPYNVDIAKNTYRQLSLMVSNLFGIEACYYKSDPVADTKDVFLKEYSLSHIVDVKNLKINVPDNEFPTKEIQFDSQGMHSMDMFEVHVDKEAFKNVFGEGKRPRENDVIWFKTLDRIYEVNSVAQSDGAFNDSSYYRVMLTDWQNRSSVLYDDENIKVELEELGDSLEKFQAEVVDEMEKVRKPNQYNTIGMGDNDYVRSYTDEKLKINEYKLRNNFTIISKYNYNLTTVNSGTTAITYRYNGGMTTSENRAFTMWINPKFIGTTYQSLVITDASPDIDGHVIFTTISEHGYSVGNIIKISGTNNYNGFYRVLSVTSLTFTISAIYTDNVLLTARSKKHEECKFMQYGNIFGISILNNVILIEVNGNLSYFDLSLEQKSFSNDNWYGIVINLSNKFKQLSTFVWIIDVPSGNRYNRNSTIELYYNKTIKLDNTISLENGNDWKLLGSTAYITNIRIFEASIEEEQQSLVLSQYVVMDTHLSLLVDNAIPGIKLLKKTNAK